MLWGETWQDTATLVPPKKESLTVPKKTKVAKISVGAGTGPTSACHSSTSTFHGSVYGLKTKAKTDFVLGAPVAKKYSAYNLTLIIITRLGQRTACVRPRKRRRLSARLDRESRHPRGRRFFIFGRYVHVVFKDMRNYFVLERTLRSIARRKCRNRKDDLAHHPSTDA